jgi:hypothetical protein
LFFSFAAATMGWLVNNMLTPSMEISLTKYRLFTALFLYLASKTGVLQVSVSAKQICSMIKDY